MKTPIVATPIQDVQLLDYVVAHETINESQNYLAGTEDIYTGLFDEDPYTSQEQRQRDQYELDNENWNEVVFEEVLGTSTAKMALHSDWIAQKRYDVHKVVHLELPEQGISGAFLITSIKHILPQKRPVDENPGDSYDFSPVTAIFTHQSDQVYEVRFDNGETLGVTYQHPIYSLTYGDWRLAGELEVGEEVLTKIGQAFVVQSEKKEGSEVVYNFEVKRFHNFLVGIAGIVVHNTYFPSANNLAKILGISRNRVHEIKALMIRDWKNDFPPGFGNNPDIGISETNKLVFKSRLNGNEFDTGFDIINYVE